MHERRSVYVVIGLAGLRERTRVTPARLSWLSRFIVEEES
jgi:hypothetical protein